MEGLMCLILLAPFLFTGLVILYKKYQKYERFEKWKQRAWEMERRHSIGGTLPRNERDMQWRADAYEIAERQSLMRRLRIDD